MISRKTLMCSAALTVAAFVAPGAVAVDEHHPDQKPATAAAPPVQKMKENVDKLRAQVDKIAMARDPAERQKLMQEHMQTLRAGMMMAGGMGGAKGAGGMGMMGGGMMMDCPMMGQMMGGDIMMQRMQQMEKRMDMMQMMLEQRQKPAAP